MTRSPVSETDRIHWPSEVVPTNSAEAEPTYSSGMGRARFASRSKRLLLLLFATVVVWRREVVWRCDRWASVLVFLFVSLGFGTDGVASADSKAGLVAFENSSTGDEVDSGRPGDPVLAGRGSSI